MGDTISITEIAAVPVSHLAGIVCRHGSALSHMAVLARALEVPAVVSLSSLPVSLLEGRTIVVDGDQGRVYIQPPRPALDAFERRIAEREAVSLRLGALRDLPAETLDGVRLPLYTNIGLVSDLEAALASGAEGVGLYRTEYQFLLRDAFPVESELDQALELLARAHRELLEEGEAAALPRTGVMIEVPSAVFSARSFAERVDLLSVGTNDLSQYILAVDRSNERVSTPYDSLHPAVLDAVVEVVQKAHERSIPVSVCGELAGDPAGALVLLGAGVDALSMSPASLSRVKTRDS